MILDDFVGVYSGKMIDQTCTETILIDSIFDDLLTSVITKEVKFQV